MTEVMVSSMAMGILLSIGMFILGKLFGYNKGLEEGLYMGQRSGYTQAMRRMYDQ